MRHRTSISDRVTNTSAKVILRVPLVHQYCSPLKSILVTSGPLAPKRTVNKATLQWTDRILPDNTEGKLAVLYQRRR